MTSISYSKIISFLSFWHICKSQSCNSVRLFIHVSRGGLCEIVWCLNSGNTWTVIRLFSESCQVSVSEFSLWTGFIADLTQGLSNICKQWKLTQLGSSHHHTLFLCMSWFSCSRLWVFWTQSFLWALIHSCWIMNFLLHIFLMLLLEWEGRWTADDGVVVMSQCLMMELKLSVKSS